MGILPSDITTDLSFSLLLFSLDFSPVQWLLWFNHHTEWDSDSFGWHWEKVIKDKSLGITLKRKRLCKRHDFWVAVLHHLVDNLSQGLFNGKKDNRLIGKKIGFFGTWLLFSWTNSVVPGRHLSATPRSNWTGRGNVILTERERLRFGRSFWRI